MHDGEVELSEGAVGAEAALVDEESEPAKAGSHDALDLVATVVLAIATVLTAWSAYQATKWSGVQANDYARSSALRAQATQASTRAGQLTIIDVTSFEQWLAGIANDPTAIAIASTGGPYHPRVNTVQYLLYERFRPEFRVAFDAWLKTKPLIEPNAPPTPFAMKQYKVAEQIVATHLNHQADTEAAMARTANQRGDNYVLLTVLFATALFFAGAGTKLRSNRAQQLAIALSMIVIAAGLVELISFPKQF